MEQLTTNQQSVYKAIQEGNNTTDRIAQASGVSKQALSSALGSLAKKELIFKNEDGTYSPSETASDNASIESDHAPSDQHPTEQTKDVLTLVIPYLKGEAAGEELKYALRSWEQNFKEDIRVIIVGDKEDWFSPQITHIPHEPHMIKEVCGCPNPALIRNPQADVAHKLFTALTVEELTGAFIVSNDDIYLLGETTFSDIDTLKCFVNDLVQTGEGKGLYAQNNRLAAKVLIENGKPTVRYGTHTPMVFDAEMLLKVIERYDATEHGYPLASLYYNEVFPNARPTIITGGKHDKILASVYRDNVEKSVIDEVFKLRKFMNCDSVGWKSVEEKIKETFSTPSRFEI